MNIYSVKNRGVAGNIWKYALLSITNKRSYLTFFSIFLLTMPGTTEKTIGLMGLISEVFGFVLEIPSGHISDKMGHGNALILAKTFLFTSTFIMIFADSPLYFFVSSILMALGFSMTSGTSAVFLQSVLKKLNLSDRYSEISGKISSFGFAVPILFIIGLPIMASRFGYQSAFAVAALIDVIGLIAVISMKKIKEEPTKQEFDIEKSDGILRSYFKIGWTSVSLFSAVILAICLAASIGFKNPFQESIGFSITMLGFLWAGSRFGISLILLASSWFKKNFNLNQILIIQSSAIFIIYFLLSFQVNKWFSAFLLICIPVFMWGFSSVKNHFFLDYVKDMKNKASYLSINKFIQKIIQAPLSLAMGYLVFANGYYSSYRVVSFTILLFLLTFIVYLAFKNKKTV